MKRFGGILLGVLLAVVGLVSAGFGLFNALGDGEAETRFLTGATAIPFGIMLLELGLAAAWLTMRGTRDDDRGAMLPPWWASALVFAVAVASGWAALYFDQWWAFFPLTTVAVFVPLAAAGRLGLPRIGWRPVGRGCWPRSPGGQSPPRSWRLRASWRRSSGWRSRQSSA